MILISIYKIQIVQKSYSQKQVMEIIIKQEYCVRRTQAKCKMTEKTNNGVVNTLLCSYVISLLVSVIKHTDFTVRTV